MEFLIKFKINNHLYVKDPESTELGKSIVKNAIDLIDEIGFEQFTFKKLGLRIETTEATVYRYFSSKHKLLIYILNWYWSYLEFVSKMYLSIEKDPAQKLNTILKIITHSYHEKSEVQEYHLESLHNIVISESSKSYLVKEIDEINKEMVFSPLKNFCSYISDIISELNPNYLYPKSLASTLLETAHDQQFFSEHLPSLTNNRNSAHKEYVFQYLHQLAFSVIQ